MVAGDREAWLANFGPTYFAELLPDWPGPSRVDGPEAAWAAYTDFFDQFDSATYEILNVEKNGDFTLIDIRCQLVGVASGAPAELLWTVVGEFDAEAQAYTSARWFHTRDDAFQWMAAS
jgi:hypothetical protein